jgi:DegV family protein with EDD domain
MNKVLILTDSTVDLNLEIMYKNDIQSVPLFIRFDEEVYLDGVDIFPDELFHKVEERGQLAKSSGLRSADFNVNYKKYLSRGYDVLYIGLSSNLSSTIMSANIAKSDIDSNRIYVVDTKNLSQGIALLVMKAKDLRDQGFLAKDIKFKLDMMVPKVRSYYIIPDLKYLYLGERISKTKLILGSLINIRPIISLVNGHVRVIKKPFGSMKSVTKKLIKLMAKDFGNIDTDYLMIGSYENEESKNSLKDEIDQYVQFREVVKSDLGCVILTHTGKHTIGIAYLVKNLEKKR